MKPVVIKAKDTPYTYEEIKKMVEDAYNAGYEDGSKAGLGYTPIISYPPYNPPSTTPCDEWWKNPTVYYTACGGQTDEKR